MNSLLQEISRQAPSVSPAAIINGGAASILQYQNSPHILAALLQAYTKAVNNIMIFALVSTCVAVPCAACMPWLNVKHVAEARKASEQLGINVMTEEAASNIDGKEMKIAEDVDQAQSLPFTD